MVKFFYAGRNCKIPMYGNVPYKARADFVGVQSGQETIKAFFINFISFSVICIMLDHNVPPNLEYNHSFRGF